MDRHGRCARTAAHRCAHHQAPWGSACAQASETMGSRAQRTLPVEPRAW
ncbi:hypothetical protein IB269_21815 [Delftia sp. DLF01]|nr:hypothetical protein [Delftia sp. DLF01]